MKSPQPRYDKNRTMRRTLPPLAVMQSFVDVVETMSVTRSAERLNLTQSAVSHHIARLELHVGVPLFERSGRAMRPTAEAARLAERVTRSLRDLSVALDEAGNAAAEPVVRVAVAPEVLAHWLAPRLEVFRADYPAIRLEVGADYRRDVLTTGEADLQIRLGHPGPGQGGFVLAEDDELVVCSPELGARLPERQAFAAAPFLTEAGPSATRLDWDRWLTELYGNRGLPLRDDRPVRTLRFETFAGMLEACRRGEGFALVRTHVAADDLAAGRLVVAVEERLPAELPLSVIHPLRPAPGVAARQFMEWLREAASTSLG